jgi:hypothetical protein
VSETGNLEVKDDELLGFVLRCFQWSNADVFALGRRESFSRLGEIATFISWYDGGGKRPTAEAVRIVLPPFTGRDATVMIDQLKMGIRRGLERFGAPEEGIDGFVDKTFNKLAIVHAADFETTSLDAHFEVMTKHEVLIVGEASHYRSSGLALAHPGRSLPEDIWSAHLKETMLLAERRAKASEAYIVLDIGQFFPERARNMELLRSAGDVGLCGGGYEQLLTPEQVIVKVELAYDAAASGDIGKAMSLIEGDANFSDLQKWVLKLVVLERANVRDEVSRILDESGDIISDLRSENLLGVARIAAGVDRDDFAQDLVERALPHLIAANDLEEALKVARDTRRRPLIEATRERLRGLYPSSELLKSVDAREAAQEGRYGEAAGLLEKASDDREREIGEVFGLLAKGIEGSGLDDPGKLAADLSRGKPAWKSDIQREIMLSLERASRRDDAVEMLLRGDVAWDETWFVFARGLLSRSLNSDSGIVDRAAMSRMMDVGAAFLAEHPAAGYARTSVADLLDADNAGVAGIAVMVMNVAEKALRQPDPVPGAEKESAGLDDMGRLPKAMQRVLRWLAKEGAGVIVPGRHFVPREVLREDPNAFLHGILVMVDRHAPEPDDPVEETLLRQFGAVAISAAPMADDPDADLPILRGTAVKASISGRPQLARDIAELVLLVAGDRPDRRRAAFAAFADIYARVGKYREALLVLAAAFELPSSRTWREMWEERSVLLRILRDLGVADAAVDVVTSLREVAKGIPEAKGYGSRLDTLELHAQLRRSQVGEKDAWTAGRLLEAAVMNAEAVLEAGDEALPAAVMLRQLVDRAEEEGVEIPVAATTAMESLNDRLAPPHRTLVSAAGRLPDAALVASIAGRIAPARYNDDVSYDLRLARTMASRLARAATVNGDPLGFAYALELLGSQGVGVHGTGPEVKAAERLLSAPEQPLAVATEIAALGVPVVGMALDGDGLMMMTVDATGPTPPIIVSKDVFDPAQIRVWQQAWPRRYGKPGLPVEQFRGATDRLGTPTLPERAIILSGDLSPIPPNVLTVGDDLAGTSRSLAMTPSLSWLQASIRSARAGDGSAAAWIPVGADGYYMDTLSLMSGEVEDVLEKAGIPLHTQSAVPTEMASADLAIVGAHGGLAESNRFFQGVSDDKAHQTDLRHMIDALRSSRVVLLFVCSGGRLDQHPESGGMVGIAHRLLDKGVDAVISPAWPIPFNMVRPWLESFLVKWKDDVPLLDAYGAANAEVAAATSMDLSRSLAMSLYGNPFLKRLG